MPDGNITPETANFGFTRVGAGETWSKNGWAFSDLDQVKLDQLLHAAFTHTHDGTPALGDPTDAPVLTKSPTGGALPAGTTYYYRVSFVDANGLETAASDESFITTDDPMAPPSAPAATAETSGGTVSPGSYSYLVTYTDNYGGETTPSSIASVQVTTGTSSRIRLDLPDLPTGAQGYNVYRARPGQSLFYFVAATTATVWYDTGQVEDQTITAPTVNSTNASNSITITINDTAFIPDGCFGWKIYRATTAGGYDGNSLVHIVTEGESDTSTTPRTDWIDTGDALQAGFPQSTSSTPPSGSLLTLNQVQGVLPLTVMPRGSQCLSAYTAGAVTDNQTITVTESPAAVQPVRFTAYFKTPPTEDGVTVRCRLHDSASNYIDLACSTETADPITGYFHQEYPLIQAASYQAETGTFSGVDVTIDNDLAAINGQAVSLDTATQWVQVHLGALDAGTYHMYATLRVVGFGTTSATKDLQIQVVQTGSGAVLAHTDYNLTPSSPSIPDDYTYQELTGPTYTTAGGVDVALRVTKLDTANVTVYNVDSMRYSADIPSLQAGTITMQTFVDGGSTAAADLNVTLWF